MTSKIEIQRICENCSIEFTARTTVTRFCSHRCASYAHKKRIKNVLIENSNKEVYKIKNKSIEDIKAKEFLNVREVAQLLNCSIRSVYYYIESGTIKAVNLGQRTTRVKRTDIDKLFEQSEVVKPEPVKTQYEISECYSIGEVQTKFGISETALQNLVKRNNIPKIKNGKFTFVPKLIIENLL